MAFVSLSACRPNRKSVEVANPCERQVEVRIWDRPRPGNPKEDFFKDAAVRPLSKTKVKEVVTDVDDKGWSAEVIAGPGTGQVLPIRDSRVLVLPARLCS
ncbi:MAG: hypothetical protein ACRDQ2_19570 [Gaiellales bacterium]